VNEGRRKHRPENKRNEAQTQNDATVAVMLSSAAVVASWFARKRVGCLDLLAHPRHVVVVAISVPCFSVSESTIVLSPCMAFFIVFLIVFYYHAIKTF
jgi:hypothetical protein